MNDRLIALISDHLDGSLTEAQREELNVLLRESAEARKAFRRHLELHARLHLDYSSESLPEAMPGPKSKKERGEWRRLWPVAAAAAVAVLAAAVLFRSPDPVATLISSENAAWESQLPTTPGSRLTPGVLHLKTGVATIRFRSGAEVVLQAPAGLELKTQMRARLFTGSAAIDVPESAVGFVLETPDGYAIDHGTAFAASIDSEGRRSSFEVLDGEISVHSSDGRNSLRIGEQEAAAIRAGAVEKLNTWPSEDSPGRPDQAIRIGTNGRAKTILSGGDSSTMHPDFLMTKLPIEGPDWERRSLLAFDVSEVDWDLVESAGLYLNLVPTGMGHAAYLPKVNRFSVYGVTEEAAENWDMNVSWRRAPAITQAVLLGSFEIPRSVETGMYRVETRELLDFLRKDANGSVTLIVVRDTVETKWSGLVHAFASDTHPEAAGPTLRFTISRNISPDR